MQEARDMRGKHAPLAPDASLVLAAFIEQDLSPGLWIVLRIEGTDEAEAESA